MHSASCLRTGKGPDVINASPFANKTLFSEGLINRDSVFTTAKCGVGNRINFVLFSRCTGQGHSGKDVSRFTSKCEDFALQSHFAVLQIAINKPHLYTRHSHSLGLLYKFRYVFNFLHWHLRSYTFM